MKLSDMEADLNQTVDDASMAPFYKEWINDALMELAAEFELPALKLVIPVSLPVDNSDWLFSMPENFHKKLFRCTYYDSNNQERSITVCDRIEDIAYLDHTEEAATIAQVAVTPMGDEHMLGIYPLPADPVTLYLWYFRKPTLLVNQDDVPDLFPSEFHHKVILPKVVIRNYQKLTDQVAGLGIAPITFWKGEYAEGLYGTRGLGPGLINYLAKAYKPPRRIGGRDPVGWKVSRYGR